MSEEEPRNPAISRRAFLLWNIATLGAVATGFDYVSNLSDVPKGRLILMGGAIDGRSVTQEQIDTGQSIDTMPVETYDPTGLYRALMRKLHLQSQDIVVISSASEANPQRNGKDLRLILKQLGAGNVHVIDTHDPKEIDSSENLEALRRAKLVFCQGGDQTILRNLLHETQALEIIHDRYMHDRNFTWAGSSAGAMVPSRVMIYEGEKEDGIGLTNLIIDTHFAERERQDRLMKLLQRYDIPSGSLAIGVNEGVGIEIYKGKVNLFHVSTKKNVSDQHVTIMRKDPKGEVICLPPAESTELLSLRTPAMLRRRYLLGDLARDR